MARKKGFLWTSKETLFTVGMIVFIAIVLLYFFGRMGAIG